MDRSSSYTMSWCRKVFFCLDRGPDRNRTVPYSEPGVSLTSAFEPPHGEDFAAACHGRPRDGGRRAVWRGVVVELVVTGPLWGAGHAHPL